MKRHVLNALLVGLCLVGAAQNAEALFGYKFRNPVESAQKAVEQAQRQFEKAQEQAQQVVEQAQQQAEQAQQQLEEAQAAAAATEQQ